jgi:hypothetical protein
MTARAKTTKTTAEPQKDWTPGHPGYTRRYPRYAIDVRIQVRMFQGGEFHNCWGRSTELGADGIGATLTGELEAGEIVTLDIPLPLSPYPLKFLTLNDAQRDTLRRVCQMLATKT